MILKQKWLDQNSLSSPSILKVHFGPSLRFSNPTKLRSRTRRTAASARPKSGFSGRAAMIREAAVTNQALADLHRDCATNIEKSWRKIRQFGLEAVELAREQDQLAAEADSRRTRCELIGRPPSFTPTRLRATGPMLEDSRQQLRTGTTSGCQDASSNRLRSQFRQIGHSAGARVADRTTSIAHGDGRDHRGKWRLAFSGIMHQSCW